MSFIRKIKKQKEEKILKEIKTIILTKKKEK